METSALAISVGTVTPHQTDVTAIRGLQTGWYRDSVTGEYYYYDAQSDNWYVYSAGLLYPLAIEKKPAPTTIAVALGDKVKIDISYKYMGPAVTDVEEYISIGWESLLGVYTPRIEQTRKRNLAQSSSWAPCTWSATLTIPSDWGWWEDIKTWTEIECKVWRGSPSVPERGIRYKGALNYVALKPEITEFAIVDYKVV